MERWRRREKHSRWGQHEQRDTLSQNTSVSSPMPSLMHFYYLLQLPGLFCNVLAFAKPGYQWPSGPQSQIESRLPWLSLSLPDSSCSCSPCSHRISNLSFLCREFQKHGCQELLGSQEESHRNREAQEWLRRKQGLRSQCSLAPIPKLMNSPTECVGRKQRNPVPNDIQVSGNAYLVFP